MTNPIPTALRLLGYFWLTEIRVDDLKTIKALPDLAETLTQTDQKALTDLALEYQRLFGFNIPPYESVFIDPSAMLLAPATERLQNLYRQAHWSVPSNIRVGAPDHLGLELMALADCLAAENDLSKRAVAKRLHGEHLALWVPPFILAFQRLSPAPFYQTLSHLTLDLLLTTLPNHAIPKHQGALERSKARQVLFPALPPPPVFRGSDDLQSDSAVDIAQMGHTPQGAETAVQVESQDSPQWETRGAELDSPFGLRQLIKRLLPPREAGLYLSRADLAQVSRALNLSVGMGDRYRMIETLFQEAGQYELMPQLLTEFERILTDTDQTYQHLAEEYPDWKPYALAWRERLTKTQTLFYNLAETLSRETSSPYFSPSARGSA